MFRQIGHLVGMTVRAQVALAETVGKSPLDLIVACNILCSAFVGAFLPEAFKEGFHEAVGDNK